MSDELDDASAAGEGSQDGHEPVDRVSADHLPELFERVRDAFAAHRREIDDLNVFPVPDGDTGTNLLLTVRSALDEARDPPEEDAVALSPRALARGVVRSARGNSGVILSQVLRGLIETIEERGPIGCGGLVVALERAEEHAYAAVAEPVEGTMLTAVRVAADRASEAEGHAAGLPELSQHVLDAIRAAVRRTTQQLDVLRDAGVVDAGARGFEVFWEAFHHLVTGRPPPEVDEPPVLIPRDGPVADREGGSLEFRYEVQYLLDATEDDAPHLRDQLGTLGDSVVVSGQADLLNVHVHTNDIGGAIEAGLAFGRPSRIQVTSFVDQIASHGQPDGHGAAGSEAPAIGCVAVLPGPGLRMLAEEHGIVTADGAAGDLPSVATLLEQIGRARGDQVIVLPGHPNIVPMAHQAADVSSAEGGRPIVVLDDADAPPRVLAALAVWDPEGDVDEIAAAMNDAAAAGVTGEVVAAVRDAGTPLGRVREGQYLGLKGREVVAIDDDPVAALEATLDRCGARDAEIVILVVGAEVDAAERAGAEEAVRAAAPDVEVEVIDGGQRPARYHLGVE